MRKFKSTPKKKAIGMFIFFVFIPLFFIWFWVFALDNKPDQNTLVILGAFALLVAYLFLRYREKVLIVLFEQPVKKMSEEEELLDQKDKESEETSESEETVEDLEELKEDEEIEDDFPEETEPKAK